MPNEDTRPAPTSATLPDLGPEFNAARDHLRATVLSLISDGKQGGDPLKCTVTAATALLGQMTADRDRLVAEVKRLTSANERMSSVLSLIDRAKLMSAPYDLWRYVEWNGVDVKHCGRAQMMIRRGWSVGVPVHRRHPARVDGLRMGSRMSDAAPPRHPTPDSLFRAIEALDLEQRAAERLGLTVEQYREMFDEPELSPV